jgi:hypothetical protein
MPLLTCEVPTLNVQVGYKENNNVFLTQLSYTLDVPSWLQGKHIFIYKLRKKHA